MTSRKPIEDRLSDVLSEFARTLVTDFPIQGILDHLVKRIVDVLPVSAAGVTLISPTTEPRFIAASDESAMRYETLQTEVGEGPCLAAYSTGSAISVADLREDGRFPRFATQALAQGLVAVFTFPLRDGDRRLGALDLYRNEAGALDDRAMEVAQTLADVACAYLVNAQTRTDLRAASEAARHASLHDGLTGLPNRSLMLQRLEHAVAKSSRTGRLVVVLYVDLDRFKDVNDTFGHHAGDALLCAVAHRVSGLLQTRRHHGAAGRRRVRGLVRGARLGGPGETCRGARGRGVRGAVRTSWRDRADQRQCRHRLPLVEPDGRLRRCTRRLASRLSRRVDLSRTWPSSSCDKPTSRCTR